MSIPLLQIDAFTNCQYAGNPAGVCFLAGAADAAWMQSVAAEMNLAETAFLVLRGEGAYDLRWFTPTTEVPLCGHATLASAP
jgi:PhzF family phenazine biosynthesis protein